MLLLFLLLLMYLFNKQDAYSYPLHKQESQLFLPNYPLQTAALSTNLYNTTPKLIEKFVNPIINSLFIATNVLDAAVGVDAATVVYKIKKE